MKNFDVPSISTSGAPDILFRFAGDTCSHDHGAETARGGMRVAGALARAARDCSDAEQLGEVVS